MVGDRTRELPRALAGDAALIGSARLPKRVARVAPTPAGTAPSAGGDAIEEGD